VVVDEDAGGLVVVLADESFIVAGDSESFLGSVVLADESSFNVAGDSFIGSEVFVVVDVCDNTRAARATARMND